MGHEAKLIKTKKFTVFNRPLHTYESSHARAHIFSSWALSPFPEGTPFYALVWEGALGAFYRVDERMNISKMPEQNATNQNLCFAPGLRYSMPFWFARMNDFPAELSAAGKIMALASYGRDSATPNNPIWHSAIKKFFSDEIVEKSLGCDIDDNYFEDFAFLREGIQSQVFRDFVSLLQKMIFEVFYNYAQKHLVDDLPLVISGGCGLNCNWNTDWKSSQLFADVFVPPCTNDTGLMIGLAADAQHHFTGRAKVSWSPYAGQQFIHDDADFSGYQEMPLDYTLVSELLASGLTVIAWVQGRCEIGPRALCNRSLLASPMRQEMQQRLNSIKQRENYRPIAPVCLEEQVHEYFHWQGESPYMLHFQKVRTPQLLPAVTHVDNTARVQTVRKAQNPRIYQLLASFRNTTGVGVLCNTSLNYPGKGFINRTSDLVDYANSVGLDGFVIDDKLYLKTNK